MKHMHNTYSTTVYRRYYCIHVYHGVKNETFSKGADDIFIMLVSCLGMS